MKKYAVVYVLLAILMAFALSACTKTAEEAHLFNQILKTTVMLLLRHTKVDQEYKSKPLSAALPGVLFYYILVQLFDYSQNLLNLL